MKEKAIHLFENENLQLLLIPKKESIKKAGLLLEMTIHITLKEENGT